MQPLEKTLRKQLENTIKAARDIAEAAARAALEQLGVGDATPFSHLSDAERELRRKLRVHGRQLGDTFLPSPSGRGAGGEGRFQTLERLTEEVAYEHWHRMLFARFLAENNLLMYPDPDEPVAVTLEECDDLAADEGAANGWELAARFAADMLPQIFRLDSPVFQLALPPEHQQKLERLVTDLPLETFTASDSLGWVYQFWQANNKERINKSELKIGARELPAVTQLFTEPYMVSFLLDNSLGAWWAARRLSESDLQLAASEAELRQKASIPGVPLEYLRFVQIPLNPTLTKGDLLDAASVAKSDLQDDSDQSPPLQKEGQEGFTWQPAAGTFDLWPKQLSELKTLDPCCGSGHFLVAAFLMLVPVRMALEDLTAREAVDRVLSENLHGLELDQRCVELAAFALAITAWRYPDLPSPSGRGAGEEGPIGYRPLPELHIACTGLSVSVAKEEWKQLGLGKKNLTIALDWLHDTFKDAPVLGSLLNPAKTQAANLVQWDELSSVLEQALKAESTKNTKSTNENEKENFESFVSFVDEKREVAVLAQGLAKAATLLAGQYQWVITNVPYLARGKQDERLRDFCDQHYPAAKNDLATVFLDRCLQLCVQGGTASIVLPQNWLFLTSYKKFREQLLTNDTWHLIARLGEGGFDSSAAAGAFVAMITLSQGNKGNADLLIPNSSNNVIRGVDVSEPRTAAEKAAGLMAEEIKSVSQAKQLENPDARVALVDIALEKSLGDYCSSIEGLTTGDMERFVSKFWEDGFVKGWEPFIQNVDTTTHYGGRSDRILWEDGQGKLSIFPTAHNFPSKVMNGKEILGKSGFRITQMRHLPITIYSGEVFGKSAATVVPDDLSHLSAIWCFCSSPEYNEAVRRIDQKLNVTNATLVKVPFDIDYWTKVAEVKYPNGLPKPYSNDPTQWIFHGHPCGSIIWDEESKWTAHASLRTDDTVLQVAVARLLGYRWPAELESTKDTKNGKDFVPFVDKKSFDLCDESIFWVQHCEELLTFADDDGIVCLPPVRGEAAAADRLLNLLAAAYGNAWSNDILAQLLNSADHAGKSLETWLREKFFTQHCKLFQHRPFIWHIWDGLRDGFAALVNYHKLDAKLLETLIYTYLGDWISRQKQDIAKGIDGAEEKLAAAESLKKKLELILAGEAPYDIFVRWKPLDQQPIGWNPDLNDGVRLNIRPFLTVPDVGKKGAGILRDKPNIKWDKDRGKDVESAPWFHMFDGDRINDHHLNLAEKRTTREKE